MAQHFCNWDLDNVVTPVDVKAFENLLSEVGYDKIKSEFLIQGFKNGFSLGYEDDPGVKLTAPNLKLRVGSETQLWNKVMKEVRLKPYAGPFSKIPYESYIQSPIGLVPKDGGRDTCLIFHLSYPRDQSYMSVNANTLKHLCKVKYSDFDQAIQLCLLEGIGCRISKSDMSSAFRNLGILKIHWRFLIMAARNPDDNQIYFFVDKCLPFGAAISCAVFQTFSDAVAYIVKYKTKKPNINYLDNFLFIALWKWLCDLQTKTFLQVCTEISFPVAMEKTVWATTRLIFLGLLIDTILQMVFIPVDKLQKGRDLVDNILNKKSKKTTIRDLQQLCGFLNFLGRAVVPGRAFTRRLYHYTKSSLYKAHHHIKVNQEMCLDLQMWRIFLHHHTVLARPFMDFTSAGRISAEVLDMASDAAGNFALGMGAICQNDWVYTQWNETFCKKVNPSIEYLELFAVLTGVLLWVDKFRNKQIILFCDNMSVVEMINSSSSSCKNCMVLIRLLVLKGMTENVRIFARHIKGKNNYFCDALSRLKLDTFHKLSEKHGKAFNPTPSVMPEDIWPMENIWLY